jgi:hypothetical protein
MRPLERAGGAHRRAREGALLVAEQRALDEAFGEGGTVDGDERLVGTGTLVVNRAGEQLLAGAGLALEEHGGARGGHGRDHLHRAAERLAVPYEQPPAPDLHDLAAEGLVLPPQPDHLQRLPHRDLQRLGLDRLREIVDRPRLDAHDGVLDTRVAGHDDDGDPVAFLLELREQVEPGKAGHAVVGDDEVDGTARDDPHRLLDAGHEHRAVPGAAEGVLQDDTHRRLVVDAEDRCRHEAFGSGRREGPRPRRACT